MLNSSLMRLFFYPKIGKYGTHDLPTKTVWTLLKLGQNSNLDTFKLGQNLNENKTQIMTT